MTQDFTAGRCLCGSIRYRITGPTRWSGYCHCESCRRFTGSVVTNWLGVDRDAVEFVDAEPTIYEKAGVRRGFCSACGSSLTYESERFPGYFQLHIGSLEHPAMARPAAHVHIAEKIDWLEIEDDLPRFAHSAADESNGWE